MLNLVDLAWNEHKCIIPFSLLKVENRISVNRSESPAQHRRNACTSRRQKHISYPTGSAAVLLSSRIESAVHDQAKRKECAHCNTFLAALKECMRLMASGSQSDLRLTVLSAESTLLSMTGQEGKSVHRSTALLQRSRNACASRHQGRNSCHTESASSHTF